MKKNETPQPQTHRYVGGGLPWASQLNTTSLLFPTVSTGYTMLPGCLVKVGLCRTLLSVGPQGNTTRVSKNLCSGLFAKQPISRRQKQVDAALSLSEGQKPQADKTYQFKVPVTTLRRTGKGSELGRVFRTYLGSNRI